jgi:hypothetical protein
MNLTRQVHPTITERAAALACLRITDAFAFAHRDNDPAGVARAGANELLGVLYGRQRTTESLALLHHMNA